MILIYILEFLLLALLLSIVMLFKNHNTFKNHNKVSKAIYNYNAYVIWNEKEFENELIEYDCMESYDKTLFRLYDWGCQRIVSKDVYEKIESYF